MTRYALGIDYGTSSCRSLLIDLADGEEVVTAVYAYPHGVDGVVVSADPDFARQHPADYLSGLEHVAAEAIRLAAASIAGFDAGQIVSVGFATTGSTPIPVDREGTALGLIERFADDSAALAWIWKDHTSHAEAEWITRAAAERRPAYLRTCGGTYSTEWFWAKIWHCLRVAPDVFAAAYSWVELCDYLAGALTGTGAPDMLHRSVTAAGHKAMYSDDWGGLPDEEFLGSLAPELAALRGRLYGKAHPTTELAGHVTAEWAARTGLRAGTPVAVGHFDAHAAGVAGGARPGVFVKVMGTSTCDVTAVEWSADEELPDIPGMCGVVRDTMIPGLATIEAGQSAVGDIFNWLTDVFLAEAGEQLPLEELGRQAAALAPGGHGLLALDWFNGNRSVLVDQRLTGLILGLTLHTTPAEVLRALVEATAFGARRILESVEEGSMPVTTIVAAGGLPSHAPWLVQCYADVLGREIVLPAATQGSAFGAALVAAVAAGEYPSVQSAQDALVRFQTKRYRPRESAGVVYDGLYDAFVRLHDAFAAAGVLGAVMKDVRKIRDTVVAEEGR